MNWVHFVLLFVFPLNAANSLRHKRWEWAALAIGGWVATILAVVADMP